MIHELVALAETQAKTAARRIAIPTAFAVVAGLFVLFAVAGLFAALFFWFEPEHGPIAAALICTAVAIIMALLALLPLAFKRRPAARPQSEGALPQFVSLMAKTAPGLGPRQLIVTAALLGSGACFHRAGKQEISTGETFCFGATPYARTPSAPHAPVSDARTVRAE